MKYYIFIITIILTFIVIYSYFHYNYPNMTYVKSSLNNKYYLVQNVQDKLNSANMLAKINNNILLLSEYLYDHRDDKENLEYKEYIELLYNKAPHIILTESTPDSKYTSYSVNKGEQIVFCLRTKSISGNGKLHDINLVTYVVLHEISHVACPIYDNHGPLFNKIFAFITKNAIKIKIYNKIDFNKNPEEYCGMTITDSII